MGAVIPAAAYLRADEVASQTQAARAKAEAIVIYDSKLNFGGIRRQPGTAVNSRVVESVTEDVPDGFYRMLRWNEDRSFSYFGMNLGALAWAGVCEANRRTFALPLEGVRQCTGGSGLMTYVHSGIIRGQGTTSARNLREKMSEISNTWSASVAFDADAPETKRMIADAATYVVGVGGVPRLVRQELALGAEHLGMETYRQLRPSILVPQGFRLSPGANRLRKGIGRQANLPRSARSESQFWVIPESF